MEGYDTQAFLPQSTAIGPKIAHQGAFISIDRRPVSSARGTAKKLVSLFKERLRKANPALKVVKDPMFCMNITCPPDTYDPNIEPAKDDVLFENEDTVVRVVDQLLKSYYPPGIVEADEVEPPTSAQQSNQLQQSPVQTQAPSSRFEDVSIEANDEPPIVVTTQQARWRSSMYGTDEEDLELLQDDQSPIVEEEEKGLRALEVSNPWTIARMNAIIKPKTVTSDGQLLSPAKSQSDALWPSSYTAPFHTLSQGSVPELLTLEVSPRPRSSITSLDEELRYSIHRLPQAPIEQVDNRESLSDLSPSGEWQSLRTLSPTISSPPQIERHFPRRTNDVLVTTNDRSPKRFGTLTSTVMAPPHRRHRQQPDVNFPGAQDSNETWFGQPMRGIQSSRPARRQKRSQKQDISLFPDDRVSNQQGHHPTENMLYSEDNTDIRDFFPRGSPHNGNISEYPLASQHIPREPDRRSQRDASLRATSAGPQTSTNYGGQQLRTGCINRTMELQGRTTSRCREDRMATRRPRASSVGSETSMLFDARSIGRSHAVSMNTEDCEEMESHFRTIQQREDPSSIAPSGKPSRLRPRTPSSLQRSKSANLPLERTPPYYQVHKLVLALSTSMDDITKSFCGLDVRRNSLPWGNQATYMCDAFSDSISEHTIMRWVVVVDHLLHARCTRIEGVDTRCEIHEGIQASLDGRKEAEEVNVNQGSTYAGAVDGGNEPKSAHVDNDQQVEHGSGKSVAPLEDEIDFDIEQFVDLEPDARAQEVRTKDDRDVEAVDDEFGEDIEDEMLMEL